MLRDCLWCSNLAFAWIYAERLRVVCSQENYKAFFTTPQRPSYVGANGGLLSGTILTIILITSS